MRLTGGGPETFNIISGQHISNVCRYAGIEPHFTVVEIGCGIGRDAIPLTEILTSGCYLGIDIIGKSIEWCNANIGRRFRNFSFYHFDVLDQLHNREGILDGRDVLIPLDPGKADRIILQSVFTHLLPDMVTHYLQEFHRVLDTDGVVYATCFLVDDAILQTARKTGPTQFHLRFEHELTPGCFIQDPQVPTGAVAYTETLITKMIHACKLKLVRPPLPGAWSGFYGGAAVDGQDVLILKKA
jgi:SAM-dependent methyltransferase